MQLNVQYGIFSRQGSDPSNGPPGRGWGLFLFMPGDYKMSKKATFELNAELRNDQGKGASRRLRRLQDQVPAIMYGGGEKPTLITLDHKKVMHALENQAFYSHLLTMNLKDQKQTVILKDIQRHPFKRHAVIHMDFQRVRPTDTIHMRVPIRYHGEENSQGVKDGGIVNHQMIDVEIRCIASELPESIDVDLTNLALNQAIHLSEINVPKGIEFVALTHGHGDMAVVNIHLPRAAIAEEEAEAAAAAAAAAASAEAAGTAGTTAPAKTEADKSKKPDANKAKEAPKDKGKDKGKGK